MHRLRNWVRCKVHRKDSTCGKDGGRAGDALARGFPELPDERQHCLTPSPSKVDMSFLQPSECMFFSRLPPELRQHVYRIAFGDQRLHMDLTRDAFLPGLCLKDRVHAMTPSRRWKVSHANSGWLWWGSVCHRHPRVQPSQDYCHDPDKDYFAACSMYPGPVPDICFIGVIGWLLACRQAYVEGIEVLYKCNTICITSVPLMLRIDSLFLPQRLHSIVSLEIKWSIWSEERPGDHSASFAIRISTWTKFDIFLKKMPLLFPNLQRLFLSIVSEGSGAPIDRRPSSIEAFAARIFGSTDPLIFSLRSTLQECHVAVPQHLYNPIKSKALKARSSVRIEHGSDTSPFQCFWRDVADEGAEETGGELGYWVVEGEVERIPWEIGVIPCWVASEDI